MEEGGEEASIISRGERAWKACKYEIFGGREGWGMTLFRENSVKLSCNLVEFGEGVSWENDGKGDGNS